MMDLIELLENSHPSTVLSKAEVIRAYDLTSDVNSSNSEGQSPLILSVVRQQPVALSFLYLDEDVEKFQTDSFGFDAFLYAVGLGEAQFIEVFRPNLASHLSVTYSTGLQAIDHLLLADVPRLDIYVDFIQETPVQNLTLIGGNTHLQEICRIKTLELAKDGANDYSAEYLMEAQTFCASYLIENYEMSIETAEGDGKSALQLCFESENLDLILMLLTAYGNRVGEGSLDEIRIPANLGAESYFPRLFQNYIRFKMEEEQQTESFAHRLIKCAIDYIDFSSFEDEFIAWTIKFADGAMDVIDNSIMLKIIENGAVATLKAIRSNLDDVEELNQQFEMQHLQAAARCFVKKIKAGEPSRVANEMFSDVHIRGVFNPLDDLRALSTVKNEECIQHLLKSKATTKNLMIAVYENDFIAVDMIIRSPLKLFPGSGQSFRENARRRKFIKKRSIERITEGKPSHRRIANPQRCSLCNKEFMNTKMKKLPVYLGANHFCEGCCFIVPEGKVICPIHLAKSMGHIQILNLLKFLKTPAGEFLRKNNLVSSAEFFMNLGIENEIQIRALCQNYDLVSDNRRDLELLRDSM